MNLLDCTLRDGGYYTDWHFNLALVNQYLNVMTGLVDVVEIGFRRPRMVGGQFGYCSDEFLVHQLVIPKNLTIGVMIDFKDWGRLQTSINCLVPSARSRIDMVRVAVHIEDVHRVRPVLKHIKALGYRTALSIMQAHRDMPSIYFGDELDVLYFADSFGCMTEDDIYRTYLFLRCEWGGEIGFHGHNNRRRAYQNCYEAESYGVTWLDGTVRGMGRGAGNVDIEDLLRMQGRIHSKVWTLRREFMELHDKHKWGPNPLYSAAARFKIHPAKVQSLLGR